MTAATTATGRCSSCHALTRTLAMPSAAVVVNRDPDPVRGTVAVLGQVAARLAGAAAAAARASGIELFTPHAVTCPYGNGR